MAGKVVSLVLINLFVAISAGQEDLHCLKAIKSSFEDPSGLLDSWNLTATETNICRFAGVSCWNDVDNKILSIQLSGMRLKGIFPTGIKYCTGLTGLNLSRNAISGPIPSDIASLMPYVTSLDLSYNNFSGRIPSNLANCRYLNVLRLCHNRLTGNLPVELRLLSRVTAFDVSYNLLSGSVPNFGDKDSYAYNRQLCGGPLEPCFPDRRTNSSDGDFTLEFGIGFAFSFAAVVFVCFSASSLQLKSVIKTTESLKGSRRIEESKLLHFPTPKHKNEIPHLEKMVTKMSFGELSKATNNFSDVNVIGTGRTGTMYKATLPNGWFLAVKRLHDPEQFEGRFVSEILALSKMKHGNLIPLLGFCIENNERLLVYKYMSNGNLFDCLHSVGGESRLVQWPLRVKVAVGTARGLAWLHHKCVFRAVHRNISSATVLVDRFFEAKISNFGSAIISNDGGAIFSYGDGSDSGLLVTNEAWESDFVKKDVYDYGIVLLELITGKGTVGRASASSLHNALVEWTNQASSSGWIVNGDIFDKQLIGQGFDGDILQLLRIASDCVHPHARERPTMLKAYERVSNVAHKYGIPCDYGLLLQPRRYK